MHAKVLILAWKPELKIKLGSVFLSFAIALSNSSNNLQFPDNRRDPVQPIPYLCAAISPAFIISL